MNKKEQIDFMDGAINKLESYKKLIEDSKVFLEQGSINNERTCGVMQETDAFNTVVDVIVRYR